MKKFKKKHLIILFAIVYLLVKFYVSKTPSTLDDDVSNMLFYTIDGIFFNDN